MPTEASSELPRSAPWRHRDAVAIAVLVTFGVMGAYQLIGLLGDPATAHSLVTPLDESIPFLPWTVLLYSAVYTATVLPVFVVRDPALFRRTVVAYATVCALSLACFLIFPVTSVGFRPEVSTLDPDVFVEWGTHLTFFVDPPINLFPSLHLASAAITALSAGRARREFGVFAWLIAAGIAVSICTMKQHFIADGVAALALTGGVWAVVIRGYEPTSDRAASWRGLAAWAAFHSMFYVGFYLAWRGGWTPWA